MSEQMTYERCQRKIDQHQEMAGMARQDRDPVDAARHMKLAEKYKKMLENCG